MTVIRPAGPADSAALAMLRYEFRSALAPTTETGEAFTDRCAEWMRSRLVPGSSWRAWVAEDAASPPAGMIWLQLLEKLPNPVAEPEWHGYITSLFVRETLRGEGLGTRLLQTALAAARERGVHSIVLWPTPRSRSLYLRHGFSADAGVLELLGRE